MKTIRLIYPQWQGGDISSWFKDMPKEQISQGYVLGSKILELLAPKSKAEVLQVPISMEFKREIKDGILDKTPILEQTKTAMELVKQSGADKILTLGGECSVSVVPFSYLASKYKGDVAMLWLDAHPDIGFPYDEFYQGYHAMAVSFLLGLGDEEILRELSGKFEPSNVLIAGLHSNEATHYQARLKELKIQSLSADELSEKSVLEWLKSTKASKLVVHFDLDALDPNELYFAVGNTGKLKINSVIHLLNALSKEVEIVGFSVAEPMPKDLLKLQNLLANLPLMND